VCNIPKNRAVENFKSFILIPIKSNRPKTLKQFLLLTVTCLPLSTTAFGQDHEKYTELIEKAWSFYDSKEYLASGETYTQAFVALGGKGAVTDRYNAACSWALANKPDSAFAQLFKIAENGNYSNYSHITTDTDLNALHQDNRWAKVIAIVEANKEKAEAKLDKPLVAKLDSIYNSDQDFRMEIDEIKTKFGQDSDEMRLHWKKINAQDSINLIAITHILDERGWLGADIIGTRGNQTLFLVIQHADLQTQLKYLPMMRKAVAQGNAQASSLALLEDRVALRQGNRQIYGSQIHSDKETGEPYVAPLIEPDYVNERRAKVGLEPIEEYIKHWNLTWDVAAHKALTKRLETE
jgi:hypothetical protein